MRRQHLWAAAPDDAAAASGGGAVCDAAVDLGALCSGHGVAELRPRGVVVRPAGHTTVALDTAYPQGRGCAIGCAPACWSPVLR